MERLRLEVRDVSFAYGGRRVLAGATLAAEPGEVLALLGPSGAGKSTLLRLMAGLVAPERGEVVLGGQPLASLGRREVAQRVALVPQDPPPEVGFTALEMVLMGRAPHQGSWGLEAPGDRARAEAALEELGISALAARPLAELSGGERRRVLLARARCQGSAVVLLDEPTAHLDLGHQAQVLEQARRWAAEGATVVAVLHDPNLARTYADAVALVEPGGRVESGRGGALLTRERLGALYGWPIEEELLFRAGRGPASGR